MSLCFPMKTIISKTLGANAKRTQGAKYQKDITCPNQMSITEKVSRGVQQEPVLDSPFPGVMHLTHGKPRRV